MDASSVSTVGPATSSDAGMSENVRKCPENSKNPDRPAAGDASNSGSCRQLSDGKEATSEESCPDPGHSADSEPPLEPNQLQAIEWMLMGHSQVAIAEELGVDPRTLYRWRKIPAFAAELNRAGRSMREQTRRRVQGLMPRVLDMLEQQLKSPSYDISDKAVHLLLKVAAANTAGRKRG